MDTQNLTVTLVSVTLYYIAPVDQTWFITTSNTPGTSSIPELLCKESLDDANYSVNYGSAYYLSLNSRGSPHAYGVHA